MFWKFDEIAHIINTVPGVSKGESGLKKELV